jgi:hypothetical protein
MVLVVQCSVDHTHVDSFHRHHLNPSSFPAHRTTQTHTLTHVTHTGGIPISDEASLSHDIESPSASLLGGHSRSSINATSSSSSNSCAGFGSVFARVVGAVVGDGDEEGGKDA